MAYEHFKDRKKWCEFAVNDRYASENGINAKLKEVKAAVAALSGAEADEGNAYIATVEKKLAQMKIDDENSSKLSSMNGKVSWMESAVQRSEWPQAEKYWNEISAASEPWVADPKSVEHLRNMTNWLTKYAELKAKYAGNFGAAQAATDAKEEAEQAQSVLNWFKRHYETNTDYVSGDYENHRKNTHERFEKAKEYATKFSSDPAYKNIEAAQKFLADWKTVENTDFTEFDAKYAKLAEDMADIYAMTERKMAILQKGGYLGGMIKNEDSTKYTVTIEEKTSEGTISRQTNLSGNSTSTDEWTGEVRVYLLSKVVTALANQAVIIRRGALLVENGTTL